MQEDVELVAFCDRTEEKARAFSQQYAEGRAQVFTDHHALLDRVGLDALVIALPPFGHTDEVECAAERGVHVLIEKPIALTSEQGWRMVEAAERAGIKTQVGFMFRFGEAVERLRDMIASGEVGPVALMSARYFCNALHADWWRDRSKSGGQLFEQVIHMFDLLRYLAGDAESVYSRQANLFHRDVPGYTVEDVSATIVNFKSGGLGVVYATNNAIPGQWINDYRVVAQSVTADFTDANHATFYLTREPDRAPLVIASDRDFRRREIEDWLGAIRTGGETRTPIREGAKSLDLVVAAMRSGEIRGEVTL
jgi:predicted dehydrogenase